MIKLLILTDWFEPGYLAGGPIRSVANLVKALGEELQIWILTSDRDFQSEAAYSTVLVNEWIDYDAHTKVQYLTPDRLTLQTLAGQIEDLKPDKLYLNSVFSRFFTIYPLWLLYRRRINGKVVLAPRGMLHAGALQYKPIKKRFFLSLLKASGVLTQVRFQATDAQEAADITDGLRVDRSQIRVISNLPEYPEDSVVSIDKSGSDLRIIFVSRLSPKKNLLFLLQSLVELSDHYRIELSIAGPIEDGGYWEQCQNAIQQLPSHIKTKVLGPLTHLQVKRVLQAHHFLVLPTHGENFGHIIFESFAAGRPVIISDQTPWRDLQAKGIGWDVSITDGGEVLRQAIELAAEMDQTDYQRMAKSAWQFAKDYVANSQLKEKYLELFSAK